MLASVSGYIGNLGDGVHKGDEGDPRVAVIEIIPDEIKYWISEQTAISRALQVAASAVMGRATAPGELRTIHKEEVSATQRKKSYDIKRCPDPACTGAC